MRRNGGVEDELWARARAAREGEKGAGEDLTCVGLS